MKSISAICFFALFCAILLLLLKEQSPRFSLFLSMGATFVFFLFFLEYITPVLRYIESVYSVTDFAEYFKILMKALGISVLVCIVSQLCRDLGESATAAKVEVCGKAVILYLSLPIIKRLFETIGEFTA